MSFFKYFSFTLTGLQLIWALEKDMRGEERKCRQKDFRGRQDLVRYRTGSHMVFIRTLLSIFMMITPDSYTPVTFTMYSLPLSSEIQTPPLPTLRVCLTYLMLILMCSSLKWDTKLKIPSMSQCSQCGRLFSLWVHINLSLRSSRKLRMNQRKYSAMISTFY